MCAVANGFSSNSQTNLFMSGGQYFQFLTNALCLPLCTTLYSYHNFKMNHLLASRLIIAQSPGELYEIKQWYKIQSKPIEQSNKIHYKLPLPNEFMIFVRNS